MKGDTIMKSKTDEFIAQSIKSKYETNQKTSEVAKLKELDKKVTKGPKIFSYIYGSISTLILGIGMCLAMEVIGKIMALGICIGVVGIALMISTYFIYKKMVEKNKKKYGNEIIELSDKILKSEEVV